MGIIHLISALVSLFRWMGRQQREAVMRTGGLAPTQPLHSPGEAPRVHLPPVAHPSPRGHVPVASAAAGHRAPAHRPRAPQQAIIDDAPHGPIEWILRRFEGPKA